MNFSYDELVRLENEAMNRVRKINESERDTAEKINRSISPSEPPKAEIPKPKRISMPANITAPKFPSIFGSGESSDSSLLLALLLLLGKEHTDTLTLLALVYILM